MRTGNDTQRLPERAAAELRTWLEALPDPEIPVLSIADLGILRDVHRSAGEWVIVITPTYSGCPAMHAIEQAIEAQLRRRGVTAFRIETRLSPPWSSDWITPDGRHKLQAYGIAPPAPTAAGPARPACPRCGCKDTRRLSEFGSTACKALYRCTDCLEPFDYFKCI